ncbi:MAG: hypothetical protein EOO44_06535 [Flavobacterium sp.]|nr:MAG: hypothetical protein EOO44_06535 [Flavobacterium sp.]
MKNLKRTPEIIVQSNSLGHKIDFKWTAKKMEKLIDPIDGNDELDKTLNKISHKASIGLTASLLEWVYWRFKGYSIISEDIKHRVEALWLSIENPENTYPLVFDTELDAPATGFINGPIWVALMNVRMIDLLYKKGSPLLQSELVGLVLLIRHITPKRKIFDKWFENTIYKLEEQFPNQNIQIDYSEETIYDAFAEPKICREFFFTTDFDYNVRSSSFALKEFISNIDFTCNPYCNETKKFANA